MTTMTGFVDVFPPMTAVQIEFVRRLGNARATILKTMLEVSGGKRVPERLKGEYVAEVLTAVSYLEPSVAMNMAATIAQEPHLIEPVKLTLIGSARVLAKMLIAAGLADAGWFLAGPEGE